MEDLYQQHILKYDREHCQNDHEDKFKEPEKRNMIKAYITFRSMEAQQMFLETFKIYESKTYRAWVRLQGFIYKEEELHEL